MRWTLAAIAVALVISGCDASRRAGDYEALEKEITEVLLADRAAGAAAFQALKTGFPEEWDAFIFKIVEAMGVNGSIPESVAQARPFLDQFMLKYAPFILSAPNDRLLADIKARDAVMATLQKEDVAQCAQYGRTGMFDVATASRDAKIAFWATQAAYYEALAAGREQKAERPFLSVAAQERFADIYLKAERDWRTANPSASADQEECALSRAYIQSMLEVPPDDGGTILARELMKTYAKVR